MEQEPAGPDEPTELAEPDEPADLEESGAEPATLVVDRLTRMTFNLTAANVAVLEGLPHGGKTTTVNQSIQAWKIVSRYMADDGKLTIVKPNGVRVEVYIIW